MSAASPPPSLWHVKPWWCQPWSIVLTGIAVPGGLWWLTHRLWLVVPVAIAVAAWWLLFLYIVPRQYAIAMGDAAAVPAAETDRVP